VIVRDGLGRAPKAVRSCCCTIDFEPSRHRVESPQSASRKLGSTAPRTMEEFLKVFEDDLLAAVQSVIDLIVSLTR
jgi:hypothetical protein